MPHRDDPVALHVPPDLDDDIVIAALRRHGAVEVEPRRSADRVHLDTFDGRLADGGLTLWRESASRSVPMTLTLVDPDGSSRPVTAAPARADRIFASDIATGAIRDRIAALIESRALTPQVRVRSSVRRITVCNADGKTVVRVAIEDPMVVLARRATAALSRRVHVIPVRGYPGAFRRVTELLGSELELSVAAEPIVADAHRVAGVAVGGVSSRVDVTVEPGMRADHATIVICRRLADIVEANLPGTLADVDTEFLHDLRVAVRRTRSVVKQMTGMFPPVATERARADLRWIQEITGPTRDLDVQIAQWPALVAAVNPTRADDLGAVDDLLRRHRGAAFTRMRRQMKGQRYETAWTAWRELLDRPLSVVDDADHSEPIVDVAGRRVRAVYRSIVKRGSEIDHAAPETLHDLRKRGKELRYLLELFGDLWPADAVQPLVSTLKDLQDELGRFQDDEIHSGQLRQLAPELATMPSGTDAIIALGAVIDELAADQRRAREDFADRFAPFAATGTRDLVEDTFAGHSGSRRKH